MQRKSHKSLYLYIGASGILIAHPLDTIKTWQQATNSTIKKSMYDIVIKNNGVNF